MKKIVRFIIILISTLFIIQSTQSIAQYKVFSDNLIVNGRKIRVQKLSLSCTFEIPEFNTQRGWKYINRIYTLHLVINDSTTDEILQTLRPEIFGYYSWYDHTWSKFPTQDDNFIWMDNKTSFYIGTKFGSCYNLGISYFFLAKLGIGQKRYSEEDICDSMTGSYEMNLYFKNFSLGISRSTLDIHYEHGGIECMFRTAGIRSTEGISCNELVDWHRWKPQNESRCDLITYRLPPNRLGF